MKGARLSRQKPLASSPEAPGLAGHQESPLPVSLRASLAYEPCELAFGTSGLRGRVVDMTQLEVYINARGFLRHARGLSREDGGIPSGSIIYVASDLRPSSDARVPEQGGRGELLQAVLRAIADEGFEAVDLGKIPTPALTFFALRRDAASIMVTGSHIPFDRNGIKFNKRDGEVLKADEPGISARVAEVRGEIYGVPADASLFDARGMLRPEHRRPLAAPSPEGLEAYLDRYLDFFPERGRAGRRVLVFQHSALARDLLVDLLCRLGADVVPVGRSETFVPIDTEDIQAAQLAVIQALVDAVPGPVDAVVSTDGDSDRPLLVSVTVEPGGARRLQFHNGDLLGTVVARYLQADAVAVPVSVNDVVDRALGRAVLPRTRIGSPHVIAGMRAARDRRRVVGFEANGGFLVGSDVERDGRVLRALPTRDAALPILSALHAAGDLATETARPYSLRALFDGLPRRASRAGLLDEVPTERSRRIVETLSPATPGIEEVRFEPDAMRVLETGGGDRAATPDEASHLDGVRALLARVFTREHGFGAIVRINYIDGIRIFFDNQDVAHVRPSGNAPQLRIYANADSPERAEAIVAAGLAEPHGLLRRLEGEVA